SRDIHPALLPGPRQSRHRAHPARSAARFPAPRQRPRVPCDARSGAPSRACAVHRSSRPESGYPRTSRSSRRGWRRSWTPPPATPASRPGSGHRPPPRAAAFQPGGRRYASPARRAATRADLPRPPRDLRYRRWPHSLHCFQSGHIPANEPLDEEFDVSARTLRYRPCIGARSQFLECASGGTRRVSVKYRSLLPYRATKVLVFPDFACELQHYIEETCRNELEATEQLCSGALCPHLVGQHAEAADAMIATQHLDESVGVG